jgi:hypothetical protein
VDLTPEGDPQKSGWLMTLAVCFRQQYLKLGNLKDLEAAMQNGQKTVNL